jgi:transcriptional regulator with XRE-family HTH domain
MLIQKLRLQRGWPQEQLAELSGLGVPRFNVLNAGKRPKRKLEGESCN